MKKHYAYEYTKQNVPLYDVQAASCCIISEYNDYFIMDLNLDQNSFYNISFNAAITTISYKILKVFC